jgi:peptidoglycan/xylan/chitin deacetylase (PgdA/CDA1 family)
MDLGSGADDDRTPALRRIPGLMMPWVDRLAAAAGRLAGTNGAILCFHGLDIDDVPSPSSMHVSHQYFETVVDCIGAGRLVPLEAIVARHLAGRRTAGMVAITADDAYASWLGAESLLGRLRVPLTLFAVSAALKSGSAFWWDRIEDAAVASTSHRWRQFEDDCGLPESYRRGQPVTEGLVRPMRQWMLAEYAGRWPAALDAPLMQLEGELGRRTPQRSMTESELSGFISRTGAQVSVHTLSHAALPFLPDHEVIAEVRRGYELLSYQFPDTLPYLAIPFGLFDARTFRLAAEAGMTVSLTLEGRPLGRSLVGDIGIPRLCVVREQSPGLVALKASRVSTVLHRVKGQGRTTYPPLPSSTT